MGPGTIYGSLQRMEDAGLVKELPARTDDDGSRAPAVMWASVLPLRMSTA